MEDITRNKEALQRREADPLTNRTVTAGWFFRVSEALRLVGREAADLTVPLLLMQGATDRVVRPDAAVHWFGTVGSNDKSLWLFRDHLHELLNEPDWRLTLAQMLDWLDLRIPLRLSLAARADGELNVKESIADLPIGA